MISIELLTHLAIGAAIAIFGANWFGWLRRPDKRETSPRAFSPPPLEPADSPVYQTSIQIPLDLAIKPRYNRES